MFRRLLMFFCSGALLVNISGCFVLLAGAAGGAGTAAWLSGKLVQQVDEPYDRVVKAAKSGLRSQRFPLNKETADKNVTQLISEYSDGKTVWIDVHRISASRSQIEVRVGTVPGNKDAADKILNAIMQYL
ncbi:MAG: DUF3568 domain-containing protein [Candidatus Omnitrophica bacterium]|nr:DUF3568 domain-containing protein [Candidatus Omnitrophota bacterium]MBU1869603.1 DUF3568 domain-containing protein [Candidatus Omnitrophota bacterium]